MSDNTDDQHIAVPVPLDVYFRWATQAVLFIVTPIYTVLYQLARSLSFAVLFILNLIYQPLAFILQPVVYLLQFLLSFLAAPFRLIAQLETIYIYLGIATIIGVTGGLAAALLSGAIDKLRKQDAEPLSQPPGRTAKQYREEKRKAKAGTAPSQISPYGSLSAGSGSGSASLSDAPVAARKGGRRGGLLAQTILEEEDSEF